MYSYSTILDSTNSNLWGAFVSVPIDIYESLKAAGTEKRVVCRLNGAVEFQCALLSFGDGKIGILVNKTRQKALKVGIGSMLEVELWPDESKYGLPMPEEFEEVLRQDEIGNKIFHELTLGKQRTLLHAIGTVKSSEGRIHRSLVMLDHLVRNEGKIDYKQLHEELKRKN